MKKILLVASIFLFSIYGCSEDDPTVSSGTVGANVYYPGESGSQFFYLVDTLDVATNQYFSHGSRTASINNKVTFQGTEYYLQRNVIEPSSAGEDVEIYFRRSENGVYFFVDTLGLADAIVDIDDSLASLLEINADPEINIFSTPLEDGKKWDAFKLNVDVPSIGFSLSIVELSATYLGTEELSIPATNGVATESVKLRYDVILRIPDDPANPFSPTPRTYSGHAWFIKDVGLAMVEGTGLLVNALAGGEFNLDDTTSVYRETLNSYTLGQ